MRYIPDNEDRKDSYSHIYESLDEDEVKPKPKLSTFTMNFARSLGYGGKKIRSGKMVSTPRSGFVYLLKTPLDDTLFKIGKASDPNNRLRTFNVKLPFPIQYECLIQTSDMSSLEKELHSKFASKRLDGEWFRLGQEDVEYICSLVKE